jgi:hypothetical protein
MIALFNAKAGGGEMKRLRVGKRLGRAAATKPIEEKIDEEQSIKRDFESWMRDVLDYALRRSTRA